MRLTLRTLLAYLDDFLEPDDTEDIAKKIEESEFATQLVHRTRDCMRRLRLGVPPVLGRGLATDPNSVAEYLDNTLAADRVPEFEKICLESDVHLAEVASCHQILTLVLGGSVEVPPELRQRMYAQATRIDAPPVQVDAVKQTSAVAPPPVQTVMRRPRPEVPEYLRESRSRVWPVAATVLIAALLTFAVLAIVDPGGWRERVVSLVPAIGTGGEGAPDSQQPATEPPGNEQATNGNEAPTGAAGASPDGVADQSPPANGEAPLPGELSPPAASAAEDLAAPQAPAPAKAAETNDRAADESMPVDQPGREVAADDEPAAGDAPVSEPGRKTDVVPDRAAAPAGGSGPPLPSLPKNATPSAESAEKPAAEAPLGRDESEGESFGRYTSKNEVLLRFDSEAGDWKRLPFRSPLVKGDRLLSLPVFRPTIALSSNITVQPDGPALLELVGWTDAGVPIISIQYGRLLMMTVGKAGNALQLRFDDRDVQLTFVDAESTAALEARRVLPPGRDPTLEQAPLAVELYATSGPMRVRQDDHSVELQAPARRALLGPAAADVFGAEFPKWATSDDSPSDADRRAATTLEPLVPSDRPVGLILKELSGDRRREVRSLAIRAACGLDNFDACIAALNDPQEKTLWTGADAPCILELRTAVARSPEAATRVRDVLEKQRSPDGAALFRMLWGYGTDDLKNGADRDLVDGLDKESLDYRVLAFWNLQNITGLPNFGYSPTQTTLSRRQHVKAWQAKLREGKVVPKSNAAPAKGRSAASKSAERVQP